MKEGGLLLEDWPANDVRLVADDTLFWMEVAVGDMALLEDKMSGNDWVDEILLDVDEWYVEDVASAGLEDR